MATRRLTPILICTQALILLGLNGLSAEMRFNGSTQALFYSLESYPGRLDQTAVDNFRYYQTFRLKLEQKGRKNSLSFNTFFRVTNDFAREYPADPASRFYNGYVQWNTPLTSLAVGRQWLNLGPSSLTLDGVRLSLSKSRLIEATGFVGLESPFSRKFDLQGWDKARSGGVYLRSQAIRRLTLGLGFFQKDYESRTALREIGINGKADLPHGVDLTGRLDLNLLTHGVQNGMFRTRFQAGSHWNLVGEYKHYEPRLFYQSYYRRFNPRANDQLRAGVVYNFRKDVFLGASYTGIRFKDMTSSYLTLSAGCPYGNVAYYHGGGIDQSQNGFTVGGSYPLLEVLEVFADLDYSRFRFYDAENDDYLFTSIFGLNWRPRRDILAGVEFHDLNDRIFSKDFRILFKLGFNYSQIF
jgi:hypothetical protein